MKDRKPRERNQPLPHGLDALAQELGIEIEPPFDSPPDPDPDPDMGMGMGPSVRVGRRLFVRDPAWVRDALAVFGIDCALDTPQAGSRQGLRIPWPPSTKFEPNLKPELEVEAASQLAHALSTALAPEAILFDLDGVLMDVCGGHPGALGGLDNIAVLAERLPLGVVTGLGRGQAARLLASSGIAPFVTEVIGADDATPKPSPDPVRLCLQRLGLARAWMLGDNPTDMTAARLAGVIPLGVRPAACSNWTVERRAMHDSALRVEGAARVIDGIADVLPLLAGQLTD